MADIKISQLPAASSALAAQEFEVNESGVSKKVTGAQIADLVAAQEIGVTVQAYDADIPTVSASQAEMEAGTEAALRSMSPLRVKQAIVANGSATAFASSAENIAGTIENKAVDPLGIREAFNATGSAPVYACRAWVNFNGVGTVAIRASGNVSSITDNGVGDYTVNFATAMPDENSSVVADGRQDQANVSRHYIAANGIQAGSVRIYYTNSDPTPAMRDQEIACVSVFR